MKTTVLPLLAVLLLGSVACTKPADESGSQQDVYINAFEEIEGLVAVEAEHFHTKTESSVPRHWYEIPTDTSHTPAENNHTAMASEGAYLEVLPDTRVTHDDSLIVGTNFFPEPGVGPVLTYNVWFNTPGIYTVWARAYSTGTEDNGLHVGLDGEWPENGQRLQWCENKNQWTWSSAQRVPDNHCGTPGTIKLEIREAGQHTIHFSMREDGFEFDKWIMTLDEQMIPQDFGAAERKKQLPTNQ